LDFGVEPLKDAIELVKSNPKIKERLSSDSYIQLAAWFIHEPLNCASPQSRNPHLRQVQ
jgi:hypothetical protein